MRVVKAHACGNDFLIVDAFEARGHDYAALTRILCSRTTSVGADGVEFLTVTGDAAGRIRLHNADGSVAEISGNGTRCVAAWIAYQANLAGGDLVSLQTDAGRRECRIESRDGAHFQISSGMGTPLVTPRSVRLADGTTVEGAIVDTGNPHFVLFAEKTDFVVAGRPWEELGREVCFHADFPRQTNVEFVYRTADDRIEICIFERGVGPTSSSGTGTCATAAAAMMLRQAPRTLRVSAPGGEQRVDWAENASELRLTGPAQVVMQADVYLEAEDGQ